MASKQTAVDVSIVIPILNGARWLEDCLTSILTQTFPGSMEISIFNDGSTDSTSELLGLWRKQLEKASIRMVVSGQDCQPPKGVGYGRNRAVEQSSGTYLCFCDLDDTMSPERIELQYAAAIAYPANTLIGGLFMRDPPESTSRYTRWHNNLSHKQLHSQAYTAFGPTIIQPTWFCSRTLFQNVGPFSERGKGIPEDLIYFYAHLAQGGQLLRLDKQLIMYRYHQDCQSFNVKRETIWNLRVAAVQERVLCKWSHFTIWNAGKQGRRLYRSLTAENRAKVVAFCDVDKNKIERMFYIFEDSTAIPKPRVPIIHFSSAKPPLLLCVKLDLTGGGFEENLASLHLEEGVDFYHFS